MRRFDRTESGEKLGLEDMVTLMGKGLDEKYHSSYESIAKRTVLHDFGHRADDDLVKKLK